MRRVLPWVVALTIAIIPATGSAQTALDRADPTLIERTLPAPVAPAEAPTPPPAAELPVARSDSAATGVVRAIVVEGQDRLSPALFADVIASSLGQAMSRADLSRLAGRIADVARARGYPFATAIVPPQAMADGVLRVRLELGRVDAVRVVGVRSIAADRILSRALATGRPVRRDELERALLLVGDLPGIRITGSRLTRQDGFGILLVTAQQDRFSAYAQIDNRGSREVGPVRSTLMGVVRDTLHSGDELTLIASQTPLQPTEFAFLRARYATNVGTSGSVLSLSGSVARSQPGGAIKAFDIEGRSRDLAIAWQYPVVRTRARSLWAGVELRTLGTDQTIAGQQLRRDRLTTLSGTLNGAALLGGGTLRGELAGVVGLPVSGATRAGSVLASRFDGDARYVAANFVADWTRPLGGPFSLVVASAGQVASRPLLATAEIGLGGPAFVRGYDYAERTGDKGIMASAEVRATIGGIEGSVVDRLQLYGFADGGTVGNLRGGSGGGTLASTGVGARIGTGRFDWMVEMALPLNADRFDTGDRRPRISLRLSRAF
ncbi:ShlB/FhaC/HecB family hemolysin secretion/activation protein [Sphingomonas adhaesiva]|uniref:ShlB/FhaC/HecB family hemolysin secretion/activation protein n=1 Tax=Sphingomonas adhaesiva TaxID=28212 RepID=UPI002FF4D9FB